MAERKSVNKYYPPDWDPSKGSINNYVGQHPLRDRAKKLHQGILVIRFEMPYNIWCGGCNAHIGMGVRYNAEKTKTGNYYSTPIYKFRMKCHLCDNYFEIQTDPKNHDYVILEGARRKEQRWDPKENEQIVPEDKATQKKLATDAMFKLEHGTDDRQKGKKAVSSLAQLETSKEEMKDDYILNKMARNKFREEKKSLKKIQDDDNALLKKSSLEIPLVEERESDVKLAGLIRLRAVETYDEKQVQKRKEIDSRPIFQSKKRRRSDESNSPQAKKFKIITDNIRKAKASSTSSPFDRINSSMLGVGLTKDLLGIRKKTTIQDKQSDLIDKESAIHDNKEIENSDNEKVVQGDKPFKNSDNESQDSISQNQTELPSSITRLEHLTEIRNYEDKEKVENSQLDIQSDKDEEIHEDSNDSSRNCTNTNVDSSQVQGQELENNQCLDVLDKTDIDKDTSESKGVYESNKTFENRAKDQDKITLDSTIEQKPDKMPENVNIGASKDGVDCTTNVESTITTKPRLSLVAAYSDSEDTDASTD